MFVARRAALDNTVLAHALLSLALRSHEPAPGLYSTSAHARIYVGIEAEPSDRRTIQYFDATTRRVGTLRPISADSYETTDRPVVTYALTLPTVAVEEQRFTVSDAGGRLGVSLWHASSAERRPTIVLVHGADDETHDMGFIVSYFVSHGLNVVTYDQRGTGRSLGDWRYTSPRSKADDVITILGSLRGNAYCDRRTFGVWGFSNGAWVAPIVATRYPLAFLILKSPAAESIAQNVLYEIEGSLRETSRFSDAQIDSAVAFERLMLTSVATNAHWDAASLALAHARAQPWFPYMRIPPQLPIPPPHPVLAALQAALVYDPTTTLEEVHTPTLALFGARDKNVDTPDSEARLREDCHAGGNRRLTVRVFAGADHTLVASTTGFEDRPSAPRRVVPGYPEVVVGWLKSRGLLGARPRNR